MGEVVKQQITQQGNKKQGTSVASAAPGPGSCSILSRGSVIRFLSSQSVTVWVAKATCITLLSQHCLSSWICSPEDLALLTKAGGGGICMYMHVRTQKRFLYFYLPKGKMYSKQFLSNAFLLQTLRTNLMGEQTDIRPSVRLWHQVPEPPQTALGTFARSNSYMLPNLRIILQEGRILAGKSIIYSSTTMHSTPPNSGVCSQRLHVHSFPRCNTAQPVARNIFSGCCWMPEECLVSKPILCNNKKKQILPVGCRHRFPFFMAKGKGFSFA